MILNMKALILLFFIIVLLPCESFAQEKDLSDEIYKKQVEIIGDEQDLTIFKNNREKAGWINKISKYQNDTIYIIEKDIYGIEAVHTHLIGSMWQKSNNKGEISLKLDSYYATNTNLELSNEMYFSSYIMYLVNNWDVVQIKKEELGVKPVSPTLIIATRIILQKECVQVDTICFDEFMDVEMNKKYDTIISNN